MKLTNITFILLAFTTGGFAQGNKNEPDTLQYCLRRDLVALGGYDVVSYFELEKPLLGSKDFMAIFEGAEYLFSSDMNKKKFIANPSKYLPMFGGWCSMTLAMGRATTPTYDNFAILSGKLYLFERTLSVNGRELWLKDKKGNEKIATDNYTAYRTTGRIK